MAQFKPCRVTDAKLSTLSVADGQLILTTDTGKLFLDNGTTRTQISGDSVVGFSVSGTTVTYTKADGTTGTFDTANTTYTFSDGLSANGTAVSNSGVRSISTGTDNGKITVNTAGVSSQVAVKGLSNAAYKDVDTTIAAASTSTKLPTSKAVAAFVEGKGYKTTDNNTTYTFASGDANGQIAVTPSGGTKQNVSVKGLAALAYKASLTASEVGAIATTAKGAANGVAELDENGKVPTSQLPSFVDDVLEYDKKSSFPTTGEAGKIYIAQDTNKTYRWSGTAYVEISASLALGETSSTAYRGDRGKTAYQHATDADRLTTATASGLYKIAATANGHVQSLTAVAKSDITALGIPAQDTTYSSKNAASGGTDVSLVTTGEKYTWNNKSNLTIGTTSTTAAAGDHTHSASLATDTGTSAITLAHGGKYKLTAGGSSVIFTMPSDNNTTYTFATGDSNGQIAITPSGGSKQNISVKGLAGAAYKAVDTSIAASSSSTNVPTSKAVAAFVEGKGYATALQWTEV